MLEFGPLDATGGDDITGLIEAFFDAVRASPDLADQEGRSAELVYELDQVVSTYLDDHELSADAYQLIQQDVLNTIAHDLADQHEDFADHEVSFDADGNADPSAVMAAIDHHFDQLFCCDNLSEGFDSGFG